MYHQRRAHIMTTYTIEIAGRPTVAFSAANRAQAEEIKEAPWLRGDLMVYVDADDVPLWDGMVELFLREAHEKEREKWDKAVAHAVHEGDVASREDAVEEGYVVFLVSVRDPTDDDFEDDEDA
jgi:hypothetical protein